MENVYMLEMGNPAVTANNAGAVRACTLAPAAKAVLGGHVKMTTRTARVIARSACLLIAIVTLNAVLVVVESATIRKHKNVVKV
jgi:hypothetical protein